MYAKTEFSGLKPHIHGGSEREHTEALRAMGANVPEDTNDIPRQLSYLYNLFKKMRFSRIPNDDVFSLVAREPLTYAHIDFYSKSSGLDFEMWEINTIMSLDSIFKRAVN